MKKQMGAGGPIIEVADIKRVEMVNHPDHYQSSKPEYETIVILENTLNRDEFIGFLKGNVFKYNDRANKKHNPTEDYAKAEWYQKYLVTFLQRKNSE